LPDLRFHLIGHLQRNKARHVVGAAYAIQSLDDVKTLLECEKRAASAQRKLEAMIQVSLAGEEQKDGCPVEDLPALIEAAQQCEQLSLVGLMTIPPAAPEVEAARPYFRRLRELRASSGVSLPRLSMGMSADFEIAIEEGATDVRVGTALFGERS
jgi:PLP dependent protein